MKDENGGIRSRSFAFITAVYTAVAVLLPGSGRVAGGQAARRAGDTLKIGLLISTKGSRKAEGEEVRRGAEMAVAEANAAAKGPRFALIVRPDDGLWGAGTSAIVKLAFNERVCALTGGVDSASAHLIEQVAQKAMLVYVMPWASDRTLTQAGVPWVFRCVPHDVRLAQALAREIFVVKRLRRIGILLADDRSARLAADAFARAAAKAGHPIAPSLRRQVADPADKPGPDSLPGALTLIQRENLQGIALFAPSAMEARVRRAVQQRRMRVPVFSPDALIAIAETFRRKYRARYGRPPTPPAAYAYDSLQVLIRAARRLPSGKLPDHLALREAVARTDFRGATGLIRFDRRGNRLN
jgi:branched-chain amino acid transport system substrate-binding protein